MTIRTISDEKPIILKITVVANYRVAKSAFNINRVSVKPIKIVVDPLKSCIFECADGQRIRASKLALSFYSKFFKEKIEGCERLGNELKFNYSSYSVETIKTFIGLGFIYQVITVSKIFFEFITKPFIRLSPWHRKV